MTDSVAGTVTMTVDIRQLPQAWKGRLVNKRQLGTFGLRVTDTIARLAGVALIDAGGVARALGEQHRWYHDFRAQLEQPGRERPVEIHLSGNWVSTISAVRPGDYDAAVEFASLRVSGDGVKSTPWEAEEQLERRLERRFWATYRGNGALLLVHFFKDVNPSDRNLLEMIATETQFVRADPERSLTDSARARRRRGISGDL